MRNPFSLLYNCAHMHLLLMKPRSLLPLLSLADEHLLCRPVLQGYFNHRSTWEALLTSKISYISYVDNLKDTHTYQTDTT